MTVYPLERRGVTPEIAHHTLSVLDGGPGYIRPGAFVTALLGAMVAADSANAGKLALGFPEYAAAVDAWKNRSIGADALRAIASRYGR